MTYPLKFRQHVLEVRRSEGLTLEQTSVRFQVGIATLTRWVKCIEPLTHRNRPWQKIDMVELARDVREFPDAYLYERADRLQVSINGIFEALRRLGVTYKKSTAPSKGRRKQTAYLPTED